MIQFIRIVGTSVGILAVAACSDSPSGSPASAATDSGNQPEIITIDGVKKKRIEGFGENRFSYYNLAFSHPITLPSICHRLKFHFHGIAEYASIFLEG